MNFGVSIECDGKPHYIVEAKTPRDAASIGVRRWDESLLLGNGRCRGGEPVRVIVTTENYLARPYEFTVEAEVVVMYVSSTDEEISRKYN